MGQLKGRGRPAPGTATTSLHNALLGAKARKIDVVTRTGTPPVGNRAGPLGTFGSGVRDRLGPA